MAKRRLPKDLRDDQILHQDAHTMLVVLDAPHAENGACHIYGVFVPIDETDGNGNPVMECIQQISFQNGPRQENPVDGIFDEDLLRVLIHRLSGFQAGRFTHRLTENAMAHIKRGLQWLDRRTDERIARGVEGTNQE